MPVTVLNLWTKIVTHSNSVLNVTSQSSDWGRAFSPFILGPVTVDDIMAQNVENAWQFSKVYKEHDFMGRPTPEWLSWRQRGFASRRAYRYPMGKGRAPEYCWTTATGQLDYVQARKKIYIPAYRDGVLACPAWVGLQKFYHDNIGQIILLDFDAYDHRALGHDWKDVVNDTRRKMGHAFVLAMMLEGVDLEEICR